MLRLACTSIPYLSSRWNWKKTVRSKVGMLGVRVPGTLDHPTAKWNPR